ncbi:hypothetical protein [Paenibacillus sp. sgz500958]|uniref:hypothetical protein n=1 Tax=Paenibacillus sp. sgz500958 TaxID=3242475 RepID=UPI0036D29D4D
MKRIQIDFVYEYKGHTENWAANYIVYKMKHLDNHFSKLNLKYIGTGPEPTGEFSYAFQTQGGGDGKGTESNIKLQHGIVQTGSSGGNGAYAAQDSTVQVQIYFNGHTEEFELEPVLTK